MHLALLPFTLLLAAVRAKDSGGAAVSSSPPSSTTVTASAPASSSSSSPSGSCSSSNIQVDPCLTATTWTLELTSSEQLIRNKESEAGATINSLSMTGLGTLGINQTINIADAHFAYNNLVIDMDITAEGIDTPVSTTINGEFDANLFMTSGGGGNGTFCLHMTSGSGVADIDVKGLIDEKEDLTPDGGFVKDDYVFHYTCTDTTLTLQGTLNGNTVVGPYVYSGNGSSSSPITCRATSCFNWEPLVQKACDEYSQAKSVAPNTRGYFGQVRNIVCAASKSTNPCCSDMFPYYNSPGCSDDWAGGFDQFVFNSFLGPDSPDFKTTLEVILNAAGQAAQDEEPLLWWAAFKSKDWGALFAGAEHFVDNLAGPFNDYMSKLVSDNLANCDYKTLNSDLAELANEHEALFKCAVLPGFTVEGANGDISPLPVIIAKASVPVAARTMRDVLVAYYTSYWKKTYSCPAISVESGQKLRARDTGNNGSLPSVSELQAAATFLNLTIPDDPAFVYDYRTWVPNVQPAVLTDEVQAATYQILSNHANVTVEIASNDSNGVVKVCADRSHFNGEAVIALSLALPGGNSSSPYQSENTTIAFVGEIVMIAPSTFPVGLANEYLFLVNNTNSTWAEHLNETSMANNVYNVLWDVFDLSMSCASLPAGVSASSLQLVDLIDGLTVASTVNPSTRSVKAVGIQGHGEVWGGGGIYAIGYKGAVASPSNSSTASAQPSASVVR